MCEDFKKLSGLKFNIKIENSKEITEYGKFAAIPLQAQTSDEELIKTYQLHTAHLSVVKGGTRSGGVEQARHCLQALFQQLGKNNVEQLVWNLNNKDIEFDNMQLVLKEDHLLQINEQICHKFWSENLDTVC